MVEAGRSVLSSYEPGSDDSGEFVVAIYRAMHQASRRAFRPQASGGRRRPASGLAKSRGDERSPQETERIREATLKRLLSTPPKPHKDMLAERKAKREPQRRAKQEK
jgi:hypothetical protein